MSKQSVPIAFPLDSRLNNSLLFLREACWEFRHAIRYRQISNQILNKRATVIARSEAPKGQVTKQSAKIGLLLESLSVSVLTESGRDLVSSTSRRDGQIASPDKIHRDRNDRKRKGNRHCEEPERRSRTGDEAICKRRVTIGMSVCADCPAKRDAKNALLLIKYIGIAMTGKVSVRSSDSMSAGWI
jgi:hypothetical protein